MVIICHTLLCSYLFLGELNGGFSDSTGSTDQENSESSQDSLNTSYMIPRTGPKVKVVKPSIRRSPSTHRGVAMEPRSELARRLLNIQSQRSGSFRRHSDIGVRAVAHVENEKEMFDRKIEGHDCSWEDNSDLVQLNFRKLMFEGPNSVNDRRHSCDSMSLYEKLRQSKIQDPDYKSLQKVVLVMPHHVNRHCDEDDEDFTQGQMSQLRSQHSQQSEHTYESITSELAEEMRRQDTVDEVRLNDLSRLNDQANEYREISHNNLFKTPANRGSYSDDQNTSSSAHHTYESIPSTARKAQATVVDTCENSAIIIGKRVSNPFENKFIKRPMSKKKQNLMAEGRSSNQTCVRIPKDDRYSPFPSAKKLAFKSVFNQAASPRFTMIPPTCGHVNPSVNARLDFTTDKLDIRTPEIKVDNHSLIMDNTEFVSPADFLKFHHDSAQDIPSLTHITTENVYQTLKACENLKRKGDNLNTGDFTKTRGYKKSLPSLSDCFEDDIRNHCNVNEFTRSTPCELQQVCNYF